MSMRLVLWGLLVSVVCLPLVFVLWLVAAAKYPVMDANTMRLPDGIRATVAELVIRNAGYGKDSANAIDRVIRLDPDNSDAWNRRCEASVEKKSGDLAPCRRSISLDPSAINYDRLGLGQENAKDFCTAEDSYTSAIRLSQNNATLLRHMGRAALRCGHTAASVAGLEVAEDLDTKEASDPSEDDDMKADLLEDREYLAVAYDRTRQPAKATAMCIKAHVGWKNCQCELTDTNVKCSDAPTAGATSITPAPIAR
jgi:tetratricopeptide (TPR) repeat protein